MGFFASFLPFNGKMETGWRPRERRGAFHEAILSEGTFRGAAKSPLGKVLRLPPPQPGWERWSCLLWLQEGPLCE